MGRDRQGAPAGRVRFRTFRPKQSSTRAGVALLCCRLAPIQIGHEVPNFFQWYGELIDKSFGKIAPTGEPALALIVNEPIGVAGMVLPWNFPMLLAAWKVAPALAAGCSVVIKPAEQTPLTALRLAELAASAGVPDGVLNVVPGLGETAGQDRAPRRYRCRLLYRLDRGRRPVPEIFE